MGRAGKTRSQKAECAAARQRAQEDFAAVPHSFVFHRGRVGRSLRQLVLDVRRAMEPYTARALKVRKKNALKDFVAVAGPLGVTHFLVFTKSPSSINFYSLIKDVVSSLKRHRMHEQQFTHHPLLVLNNFGLPQIHVKLMATMLQNMFPSINVHKVSLNTIKRCVLVSYNTDTQLLDVRHYSLKVVPVGVSKGMKKLLQERFPNLSRLEDISELLVKDVNLSESEAEQDGAHNILELPQAYAGRGNMKAQQSAVRLTEIGPRLTLQLVKVEEGLGQGNVLYHSFVHKTEAEVQEMLARREEKLRLKAERRRKQEADVDRKQQQREENRKKSLEGMKKKQQQQAQDSDSDAEDPGISEDPDRAGTSDDDAEYYREAVGEEPDKELFPKSAKRKQGLLRPHRPNKRLRPSPPGHLSTTPPGRAGPKAKRKRPPGPWPQQDSQGRPKQKRPRHLGQQGPKLPSVKLRTGLLGQRGKSAWRRPGQPGRGRH
ncbi:suppressor of SWI4 1 homolog isoform X2 [Alligator mississippiensis]|uniref:suppressor of SWI4 1 homolog isoform X2 n=1 Tax=Alligator mississippiensis TaxID=8496 RepID=UPI002878087F|nr:suppressor of SWI4 1 homolog isoform X2 [Alligator mississippiensis]